MDPKTQTTAAPIKNHDQDPLHTDSLPHSPSKPDTIALIWQRLAALEQDMAQNTARLDLDMARHEREIAVQRQQVDDMVQNTAKLGRDMARHRHEMAILEQQVDDLARGRIWTERWVQYLVLEKLFL